ncbi:GNAT family N-acetyltransferase [Pseudoxanthomonas putridarboris]|uniref:GNAT family N-acetyltransferase n=1 Tax=Pseudoxanthomonas putridarboris TaxID=752605 RepID=A0ABU9J0Z7_9GAMM
MTLDPPALDIHHDPAALRFATTLDGREAELLYSLRGTRMVIEHTGVPEAIGGRGVAAALVRAALEFARTQGWQVIPACSYSAAYVQRHPEYADLLATR